MEKVNLSASNPGLEVALEQVRANREEAEKFVADPESYLRSKGVNTDELKFRQTDELSDSDLEAAAGGAMAPCACSSVGAGGIVSGCGSIGDCAGEVY
jgi:hypothetical protein